MLPYYNTWGDERIAVQHCFFFWCSTGPDTSYGDVVLQPGTDIPTQETAGGGERCLPTGYTGQRLAVERALPGDVGPAG